MRPLLLAAVLAFLPSVALADPCTAPLPAKGTEFEGTVKHQIDGDGFCVGNSADPSIWIEVRVADFYAPESTTPEGKRATQALRKLVFGKRVECVADHRSYDRIVAVCTLNGESVGDLLRRAGVAEGGNGYRGKQ